MDGKRGLHKGGVAESLWEVAQVVPCARIDLFAVQGRAAWRVPPTRRTWWLDQSVRRRPFHRQALKVPNRDLAADLAMSGSGQSSDYSARMTCDIPFRCDHASTGTNEFECHSEE